ncbi:helix-turn-helix transcriptional regulator [Pseudoflavitalea sp. G-6-1-2]|uniref:helix-turn-helix transcriptional regulator n=1 Tax=Pseudoflavitalea sp. G-6-1-2 TaxID=2728841 RepID=UPI00146E7EC0|nr:AraC family transcriptional regulator [Pseudoflavitalea sp. G-6-1-2]NML20840.1 helix-turn-helix transcriptional regulator [Pseudoflavitalea sp. G-6-1-2]
MSLVFRHSSSPNPIYQNSISDKDLNSAELVESLHQIDAGKVSMQFSNWCFGGFRLAYNKLQQQQNTIYDVSNHIDAVKIYFNKRGRMNIHYQQLNSQSMVGSGQFNILYANQLNSRLSHFGDQSEMFSLQFTRECFQQLREDGYNLPDQFTAKVSSGAPSLLTQQWQQMNTAMDSCIDQMIHCNFAPSLKKIYLHSKSIELMVLIAHSLSESRTHKEIAATDKEKLYFVRDYLLTHFAEDISLSLLAKQAGLNEFALKKGFKALFNSPVIDFLISHRLEMAKEQLLNTALPVNEIAYQAGFGSAGYFGKAFRKKFGVNPLSLRKGA